LISTTSPTTANGALEIGQWRYHFSSGGHRHRQISARTSKVPEKPDHQNLSLWPAP